MVRALMAVVLAGLLLALPAGAATQDRDVGLRPGAGRISGRVSIVEAGQRTPLRRAAVTLSSTSLKAIQGTVATDAQGEFAFDRIAPGIYRVAVTKPGFVSVSTTSDHTLETAGNLTVNVDVQKAGAVEGRFIDARGVPIERLEVTAELVTPSLTVHSPASFRASTDDRGRFRIHTLPPGRYRVHALPPPPASGKRLYFPGTEEVSEAMLIEIGSGDSSDRLEFTVQTGEMSAIAAETTAAIEREFQLPDAPGFDGRITGRVMRSDVGLPVGGATVTMYSSTGVSLRTAMTDGDGQFVFPRLSPGRYTVAASAGGFINQSPPRGSVPGGTTVTIASGSRVRADQRLVPTSAIEVRVIDEFGDPAPGVVLRVTRKASEVVGAAALVSDVRPSTISTDDRGWFRIPSLLPGDYMVVALPAPFAPSFPAPFAPTYFPGVPDADAATAIQVGAGVDAQATFVLGSAKATTFSGGVQNQLGQPVSTARLVLVPAQASTATVTGPGISAMAAKDGSFVFRNIPEGRYLLHGISNDGFGTLEVAVQDTATPAAVVTVKPLAIVRGHVHFEGLSAPPARAALQLSFRPTVPAFGAMVMDSFGGALVMNENGDFEIRQVGSPGLIVQPYRGGSAWVLSRVVLHGRDITDVPYDFQDGDTDGVQVFLTSRVGTVTGTVRDGAGPLAGAAVLMFGADSVSPYYVSRTTSTVIANDQGVFEIARVLPGRYYAVVMTTGAPLTSQVLDEYRKIATVVVVAEGTPTKLALATVR